MMKSPAAAEKFKAKSNAPGFSANAHGGGGSGHKKKNSSPDSDSEPSEAPVAKKKKVELVFEDELKAKEENVANGADGSSPMKAISRFEFFLDLMSFFFSFPPIFQIKMPLWKLK